MKQKTAERAALPLAGLALPLALAALVAGPALADGNGKIAAAKSTGPAISDATPTDIAADFTIHVGGLLFIQGNFEALVEDDSYRLAATMGTAGTTRAFYPADYKLASEGRLAEARVKPRRYVSDSNSKHSTRKVTISYSRDGMPRLTAEPPYDPGDLEEVMPTLQQGTQDPVSAFLMPVAGTQNPCKRTIPVFDGKRRYDLKLSYEGTKEMTPRGFAKPVTAMVCTVRYVAVAPVERRKFTDMLRRNDDMTVWLAPFDDGRVYMPVRFQLRTPLGGAVMELTNLTERTAARADAEPAVKTAMK